MVRLMLVESTIEKNMSGCCARLGYRVRRMITLRPCLDDECPRSSRSHDWEEKVLLCDDNDQSRVV